MWSSASISRAVQILLHFHFHPSSCVKAHPGLAKAASSARETTGFVHNLAGWKRSRNVHTLTLCEATFLSRLAFLPLLEVPVLRHPVKGDSRWYKHDKERDFLPCFPLAGAGAGLAEQRHNLSMFSKNVPRWGLASNNGLDLPTQHQSKAHSKSCPAQRWTKKPERGSGDSPGPRWSSGHPGARRTHEGAGVGWDTSRQRPPRAPVLRATSTAHLEPHLPRRPGEAAAGGQGLTSRLRGGSGRCGAGGRHEAEAHPPPATPPGSQNGGGGEKGGVGDVVVTAHQRGPRAGRPFSFGLLLLRAATRRERPRRPAAAEGRGGGTGGPGPARPGREGRGWAGGEGRAAGTTHLPVTEAERPQVEGGGAGFELQLLDGLHPSRGGSGRQEVEEEEEEGERRAQPLAAGPRAAGRAAPGRAGPGRAGPSRAGPGCSAEPAAVPAGRWAAAGCRAGPGPRRGTEPGCSLPWRPARGEVTGGGCGDLLPSSFREELKCWVSPPKWGRGSSTQGPCRLYSAKIPGCDAVFSQGWRVFSGGWVFAHITPKFMGYSCTKQKPGPLLWRVDVTYVLNFATGCPDPGPTSGFAGWGPCCSICYVCLRGVFMPKWELCEWCGKRRYKYQENW